jgi:hypothetical protein
MRAAFALATVILFGSLTVPAAAQSAQDAKSFPVVGSAPEVCTLERPRIQPGQLVNFNGLDGDTLQILELVDSQSLAARPARVTLSFTAVCNFPHRVRVESQNNGLWPTDGRQVTDAPGFATALPYEARVEWGPTNGRLEADAKVRHLVEQRISVDAPAAGELKLSLRLEAGASNTQVNAPVLAGVYGDTLRIYLEPR